MATSNIKPEAPVRFVGHVIDTSLPMGNAYAQTAAVDLDNCGRPEFVVGQFRGTIFGYKQRTAAEWERFILGENSPSDVQLTALDVDRDGWVDLVAGGAWYRNSRKLGQPFERIVFDPTLSEVHDMVVADMDGDGRMDVVTMSDRHNVRWYKIPEDPTQPWVRHNVGPAVHAGIAVGDIDGDGRMDIVRTDCWFQNVRGDGTKWVAYPIGPNTFPPPDFQPDFAYNATRAVVCDMNRDGKMDVVYTDAEIPGGKVWWMENVDGKGREWRRHDIYTGGEPRRGAFHSLCVADFDGDGDWDVLSCEMEYVRGRETPRFYLWENIDGRGEHWREHVIYDGNLGGHEAVIADFAGNGRMGIMTKPWRAHPGNAVGGKTYVLYLENVGK